MSQRNYDEVMEELTSSADYELVVSSARVENEDGEETYLGLVTVDGLTRGVISRDDQLSALNAAADRVLLGEDASAVRLLRRAIEEVGFDRAVDLMERER